MGEDGRFREKWPRKGQYLDTSIIMDVLADTGRGGTQGTAGQPPAPLSWSEFVAVPLALGAGHCVCPWDVPEEGLLESLLL